MGLVDSLEEGRQGMGSAVSRLAIRLACVVVLGLGVHGCNAPRAEVSGRVTYKGEPLVIGAVTFVGKDNVPVQGEIQPDGRYTVTGVRVGDNMVAVNTLDPEPPGRDTKAGKLSMPGMDARKIVQIPEHYGDPRKSGLHFKIDKGANTFNIPLD